nr:hypothetical protein [uncultured Campylobacter sp.]
MRVAALLLAGKKGDKFKKENRRESKFSGDLINFILWRIGALSKTPKNAEI